MPNSPRYAFSLIELSIVLVILGLLTGGILAGRSLVRASELRSLTVDINRYTTAVFGFRDKYFMLPGDISNAYSIWGSACGTNASAPIGCNGNGDNIIKIGPGSATEGFRFWQHLALAGMIEGSYTGVSSGTVGTNNIAVIGTNLPATRIANGGMGVVTDILPGINGTGVTGTRFYAGAATTTTPYEGFLTAEESWNMDTKMDDGIAGRGKFMAVPGFSYRATPGQYCVAPVFTALPYDYIMTDTAPSCSINYYFMN